MTMHNLYTFSNDDIAKYWKEGKDSGESCLHIDDQKRYIVYFQAVGQVSNTFATLIGMGNDDNLMATVDEFLGE